MHARSDTHSLKKSSFPTGLQKKKKKKKKKKSEEKSTFYINIILD